ncbi:MAG TPA: HigA family addiction module antitoxin [Candidatus Acidoferrum sp.]|jgi:addiction module HigA family antidote
MVTGEMGGVKSEVLGKMKRMKRGKKKRLDPVHPEEVLREGFLKPLGLTVNKLAWELQVPATRIAEIVCERRRVTADTTLRLARRFNTNAEFWLNLQNSCDLEKMNVKKEWRSVAGGKKRA